MKIKSTDMGFLKMAVLATVVAVFMAPATTFAASLPDLVPTGPVANSKSFPDSPGTFQVGIPVMLSEIIANKGSVSTGASFSYFFQVAPYTGTNSTGPAVNLSPGTMPALDASPYGYGVATTTYTFPSTGYYLVSICADKSSPSNTGTITESDETNNCGGGELVLAISGTPLSFSTTRYSSYSFPSDITLGDLNGDFKTDIALLYGGGVNTLLTNGSNFLAGYTDGGFSATTTARRFVASDLNGDGKQDIATVAIHASTLPDTVSVFTNTGNGTFNPEVPYNTGGTGNDSVDIAAGDLNGDGKSDMVVANQTAKTISVFISNSNGTFKPKVDYATQYAPVRVAVSDLNGDGKPDVVVATSIFSSSGAQDTTFVFINKADGTGTLKAKVPYLTGGGVNDMAVGDLNGDGKPDIAQVVGGSDSNLFILFNNGDGTFASVFSYYPAFPTPIISIDMYEIALGDMNGDGKLDIVVTGYLQPILAVLLNNGTGTNFPIGYTDNYDVRFGAIGALRTLNLNLNDVDGDGKPDIIFSFTGNGPSGFIVYHSTQPTPGTVNVTSNVSSSWTITGPATITGSGTSQNNTGEPPGTYTITWNPVAGYTTPPSQSLTLASGGTITFTGAYAVPAPTNVTATASGSCPNPTVTISWNAVTGANSYSIKRNGTVLGSPTASPYVDSNPTQGINLIYYVAASLGGVLSAYTQATPTITIPICPSSPDLTVIGNGNLAISGTLTEGQTLTFTGTIKNSDTAAGATPAGVSFNNKFQIDSATTPTDVPVNNSANDLAIGATKTITTTWVATAGSHTVRLCADLPPDPNGAISESNEGNNCGSPTSFTIAAATVPDLVVSGINFTHTLTAGGSPITFTATILNQGAATASAAQVRYRVADLSGSYTSAGATTLLSASNAIPNGLGLNAMVNVISPSYTLPTTAGTYNLEICADSPTSTVNEGTNEGNNCTYDSLIINPAPPTNVTAVNAVGSCPNVTVSWNASLGADSYLIKRGSTILGSSGASPYTDTTAVQGTTYTYKVAANLGGFVSAYTAASSVTIPTCAAAPATVTITATPNRLQSGGSTLVAWSSTNASSCAVTRNGVAWQSGLSSPGVSDIVTAQTTYTATCVPTAGGASVSKSAVVNLVPGFSEF